MGPMPRPGAAGHVAHLLLLNAKALLVEVALQLFIAEVDAQLLKRVGLQNLKPKDILSQKKKRDQASAWFAILQAVSVARISGAVATHQDADLAALLLCAQATAAKDDIDLVAQV